MLGAGGRGTEAFVLLGECCICLDKTKSLQYPLLANKNKKDDKSVACVASRFCHLLWSHRHLSSATQAYMLNALINF